MSSFSDKLKCFIKSRSKGFWVAFAGAALLLITAIIYSATFGASTQVNLGFQPIVLVLSLIGVVGFGALSAFKVTEEYAAPFLFAFGFLAFIYFNLTSYVYLSAVFFEVKSAEQFFRAFETIEFGYAFTLVALIAVWVCSTIGIFTAVRKSEKENEEKKEMQNNEAAA